MTKAEQKGKHVLVVNDDPAILGLFKELLEEEGYEVTLDQFGRSTNELHEDVRRLRPDLLILDYVIGREGSGWQLLQAIKMDRETRDIPVIVCSGALRQLEELRPHLLEMNVQAVIKPFDIDYLLEVIDQVWEQQDKPTVPKSNKPID